MEHEEEAARLAQAAAPAGPDTAAGSGGRPAPLPPLMLSDERAQLQGLVMVRGLGRMHELGESLARAVALPADDARFKC